MSDTRHLVVLYLHSGGEAPDMRGPSWEELHLMWRGLGKGFPSIGTKLGSALLGSPPGGTALFLGAWEKFLCGSGIKLDVRGT